MVTDSKSSGRAAQDPPQVGRPSERATASPRSDVDKSFTEHFGESGEAQERVILDRSVIVERVGSDGTSATVLTDSPQPGDLPQGVADRQAAQESRSETAEVREFLAARRAKKQASDR